MCLFCFILFFVAQNILNLSNADMECEEHSMFPESFYILRAVCRCITKTYFGSLILSGKVLTQNLMRNLKMTSFSCM